MNAGFEAKCGQCVEIDTFGDWGYVLAWLFSLFLRTGVQYEGAFIPRGGGARRYSHIKRGGMLVVSLRGVNFGIWSHLGCSGQNAIICSREGLL